MKKIQKGFTLIELLVVVLIIGILAAVMLPQYQRAVDKAKIGRMLPVARDAMNALDIYYMANGTYPTTWRDLDLDFSNGYYCGTVNGSSFAPASEGGCDNAYLFREDGFLQLLNGHANVHVYLKGEKMGTSRENIDMRILAYPAANVSLGGMDATAGKIWCFGKTTYGTKLCSSMGPRHPEGYNQYRL